VLFLSKENEIEMQYLPPDLTPVLMPEHKGPLRRLEDVEKEHILAIFREVNGYKKKAAEILGIDPKTLNRKLSSYGIEITE
jgi:DNA-binding NtrC family response regulator